jgi:hypothetical protein
MPPINQQSSRGGLITALVAFVILFIVSTVFAFQFYGKWQQSATNYDNYKKTYNGILSDGAINSAPVQAILAAKTDQKLGATQNDTVVDILLKQQAALASTIGAPPEQKAAEVVDAVDAALKDDQKKLDTAGVKVTIPSTGLQSAVNALADTAISEQKQITSLTSQLTTAQASAASATKDIATINAQRDGDVAKATQSGTDTATQLNASLDANKATIAQMTQAQADDAKKNADLAAQQATELAAKTAAETKDLSTIDALRARLANRRSDVTNSVVRQSDGKIVRIPNDKVCYINLGQGDQVTNGLTFEVYDKAEGVPPLPENVTGDEQLPVGKASIEITHVGVTSSECRIVKIQPGAIISEGDLIANLVYDPHVKFNFFVFGNFDLAENGRPNANDAAFIKQLVTQWGGKLTDQVNVNTDFVVLGAEPVIPNFSKDEIGPDAQAKIDAATKASEAYQEIRQEAKDLHIPILNQNRFLYYVGYYDQAKR